MIENRTSPKRVNPTSLLLYGAPKVGKTTALSKLKDCLIIDTEKGSNYIENCQIASINNLSELKQLSQHLSEMKPYKYIAIDTLAMIVNWVQDNIVMEHNHANPANPITSFADLPYGLGYQHRESKVFQILKDFRSKCVTMILIGHRKIAQTNEQGLVDPASLDMTGGIRNKLMAFCDSAGLIFRDEDQNLMVSFETSGDLEAGSRNKHLRGKVFPFEWDKIFLEPKKATVVNSKPRINKVKET